MLDQLLFIEPKPGAVVVARVRHGSQEQCNAVAEVLRDRFPDNKVLVLNGDASIDVLDEEAVTHCIGADGACTTCGGPCRVVAIVKEARAWSEQPRAGLLG